MVEMAALTSSAELVAELSLLNLAFVGLLALKLAIYSILLPLNVTSLPWENNLLRSVVLSMCQLRFLGFSPNL